MESATSWVTQLFSSAYGHGDKSTSRRVSHATVVSIFVAILQFIFQRYIFYCPEVNYRRFALFFFVAPAAPLFFVGALSSADLQNAIRGLCYSCFKPKRRFLRGKISWKFVVGAIVRSHAYALTAPFVWMIMCLLNKTIPICYIHGPRNLFNGTDVQYDSLATRPQLFGFNVIIVATFVVSVVVTIKQCFAKPSPGKDIVEFELIDNYTSYEADSARQHFEEIMKKTAQESGRKKVDLLIEKYKTSADKTTDPIDKVMEEMSYGYFIEVKRVLTEIYPKLYNEYDDKFHYKAKNEWDTQARLFRQAFEDSGNHQNTTKFINENTPLVGKSSKQRKNTEFQV